jgi:acetyl esterase
MDSTSVEIAAITPEQRARGRRARPASGPVALVTGRPVPGVTWTDGVTAGDGGSRLAVRFFRPAGPARPGSSDSDGGLRPLVVHLHGGGWVLGNPHSAVWLCTGVAAATGAVVASVDYRLAPEHRFPTAALDCHAATTDLVARADELGLDPHRVAVIGDSAGGNLAAVISLLARDAGPAIAAQALVYPATDGTLSSPSLQRLADAAFLDLDDIRGFLGQYVGPDGDPTDERLSPLLAASHAGLPPTLVQTAEHDPLVDDGLRYAQALAAAGVPVRYTCYQGMPHGFLSFPGLAASAAHQARAEIVAFLSAAFTGTAVPDVSSSGGPS